MKIISRFKISTRKTILSSALAFLLFFSIISTPKAQAWDAMAAVKYQVMVEQMIAQIKSIILGAAKQTAVKILYEEINALIDGTMGEGVRFVTDWEDYLKTAPEREATKFANDYISQMTKGRGSSNYRVTSPTGGLFTVNSEGFKTKRQIGLVNPARAQEDGGWNGQGSYEGAYAPEDTYTKSLADRLRLAAEYDIYSPVEPTYQGNPSQMFANGSFKEFDEFTDPINFPVLVEGRVVAAKGAYEEQLKENAKTRIVAGQGFLGNEARPGILDKDILASIEKLPGDIIANAKEIPEVIVSTATAAITKAVQKGVGMVQQKIHREVSNVRQQIVNGVRKDLQTVGPKAIFEKNRR